MFRFVIASEIEPEALADFRLNDSGDRLAPQAQKTRSLRDYKLWNASMLGGVQQEVSNFCLFLYENTKMKTKFFWIPALDSLTAEGELNTFLASHRVIKRRTDALLSFTDVANCHTWRRQVVSTKNAMILD